MIGTMCAWVTRTGSISCSTLLACPTSSMKTMRNAARHAAMRDVEGQRRGVIGRAGAQLHVVRLRFGFVPANIGGAATPLRR